MLATPKVLTLGNAQINLAFHSLNRTFVGKLQFMKREDFEIMAPVGSRESLAAAIHAGANSIYFGIGKLNMRSHSANAFTIDDLKEIAQICHEHGLKSYLTVNTIIYGEDIDTMHEIIDAAKEARISAVIASDVAVMTYCRKVDQEVTSVLSSTFQILRHSSSMLSLPM